MSRELILKDYIDLMREKYGNDDPGANAHVP